MIRKGQGLTLKPLWFDGFLIIFLWIISRVMNSTPGEVNEIWQWLLPRTPNIL